MKKVIGIFSFGFLLILTGTVAYYANRTTGQVSATTLPFEFNMTRIIGSNEANFDIVDLNSTSESGNSTGIVPGDKGQFIIKVNSNGSGTSLEYTITFSSAELPSNLKFYFDSEKKNAADFLNGYTISGKLSKNTEKEYTVYWEWPYDNGENNSEDIKYQGKSFTINVAAQGKQVNE